MHNIKQQHTTLEIHNLSKRLNGKEILNKINLKIEEGEIVGLIGQNGAGKTTLLMAILGITSPTSGSFALFGITDTKKHSTAREGVNFAASYVQLPGNLTVRQNLT